MNKSDDPNAEWDKHFSTVCTQKAPSEKSTPLRCVAPNCQVVLGPSNHLVCSQCGNKVCLAHRVAEHHDCAALRRMDQLNRINKLSTSNCEKKTIASTSSSGAAKTLKSKKKTASTSTMDSSNTLRGTAERRQRPQKPSVTSDYQTYTDMQAPTLSAHSSDNMDRSADVVEPCPICGQRFNNAASLVFHVDSSHTQTSSASAANVAPPVQTTHAGGSEVRCLIFLPSVNY